MSTPPQLPPQLAGAPQAQGQVPPELAALMGLFHANQAPVQRGPQGQPAPNPEQQWDQVLEELLGGEIPGEGYLFAKDPEARAKTLIETTPEQVRATLLRAVETLASDCSLPYGADKKSELAKGALALSQAYLLLDPTVDEAGVPVGAQAGAQGDAQVRAAEAQAAGQAHVAQVTAEANHVGSFKEPVTALGHPLPPRWKGNVGTEASAAKHKPQSQELAGTRADTPRPQPRVGSSGS